MGSAFRVPNPHPPGSPTLAVIPQRLVGQKGQRQASPSGADKRPPRAAQRAEAAGAGLGKGSMVGGERRGQHRDEVGTRHIRLRCTWLWIRVEWEGRSPQSLRPRLGRPSPGGSGGRRVWAAAAGPSFLGWAEELGPRR